MYILKWDFRLAVISVKGFAGVHSGVANNIITKLEIFINL